MTFWPIGKKYADWVGPNNFYVFLRLDKKLGGFEFLLESSDRVARSCAAGVKREQAKGLKQWALCFYPLDGFEQLKAQWEQFGIEAANEAPQATSEVPEG